MSFADGVDDFSLQGWGIVVVDAQEFFAVKFRCVSDAVCDADNVCSGGVGLLVAVVYFCEVAAVYKDAVCVLHVLWRKYKGQASACPLVSKVVTRAIGSGLGT